MIDDDEVEDNALQSIEEGALVSLLFGTTFTEARHVNIDAKASLMFPFTVRRACTMVHTNPFNAFHIWGSRHSLVTCMLSEPSRLTSVTPFFDYRIFRSVKRDFSTSGTSASTFSRLRP
jgi:hypothetical protein